MHQDEFFRDKGNDNDEAEKEGDATPQTEEVHGLFAESFGEGERHQVEVAVHETVPAELGGAIFAFLVVNHLLANLGEPRPFGDDWNVAVHLAVNLNVLHHILAVGFQSAVEVVKLDFGDSAGGGIEEFGRDVLQHHIVVTLFLPA